MNSSSRSTRLQRAWNSFDRMRFSRLLMILFFASLAVHVSVVTQFIDQPIALDDMFQYDMLARSIQAGNGFRWYSQADVETLRPYYSQFLDLDTLVFPKLGLPTTFRAPGYPFFLALMYLLVPSTARFILVRLVQAVLAAALTPLAAILGNRIGLSRRNCLTAGLIMTFYPILLFYPIGLVSENVYILVGVATVIAIEAAARKPSWRWLLLAGGLAGITLLTRSIFAIFVLLAGIWLYRHHPYRLKASLIFLIAAFGICLPWSIRNSILMKKPAFVENSLGYNLFIGYHPEGDGGFVSEIAILPMNILDDASRDSYCLQQAISFIRADPGEAVRRIFTRLIKLIAPEVREFNYFYSNDLLGAISPSGLIGIYLLLILPWGLVLIFSCIGLWQARDRSLVRLVILFILGYGFPHLLIIAEPRFHLAWVPLLVPFAVLGLKSTRAIPRQTALSKKNFSWVLVVLLVTGLYLFSLISTFPTILALLQTGGNTLRFSY